MAALPSYVEILFDGYGEERQPVVLRTDMESGPPKQLKQQSRAMVSRPCVLFMSKADYASFLTWFKTTINQGASWFDFTDPRTGSVLQGRFVGGQLGKATPRDALLNTWQVPCTIETWE